MTRPPATSSARLDWRRLWSWLRDAVLSARRGLVFFGLAVLGAACLADLGVAWFVLLRAVTGSGPPGQGRNPDLVTVLVLTPVAVLGVRWLARTTRSLVGNWSAVPIPSPYRPRPASRDGDFAFIGRISQVCTDPATWRDFGWVVVNTFGGWVLATGPAVLAAAGLIGSIGAPDNPISLAGSWLSGHNPAVGAIVGLGLCVLGLRLAEPALRMYENLARALLASTSPAELTRQVQHLTQSRADTIDAGAAELRRIERDLHDGAQARLVAMGMTLDTAEQLLETDPTTARALLAEARTSSARALAELRDLIRGVHPPVLADRGLTDAIRALALDSPVRAQLIGSLPARPPAPVESAAYFAVSELLANVAKHAAATHVWIDIDHDGQMLRISVTDDGVGGADPARGTGLRGVERRLAAFDGVLALASPPCGPTIMTLEIPCELSLPKTSSS